MSKTKRVSLDIRVLDKLDKLKMYNDINPYNDEMSVNDTVFNLIEAYYENKNRLDGIEEILRS